MKFAVYRLVSKNDVVNVSLIWPLEVKSSGGLEQCSELPPIPGREALAIELWAENEIDNEVLCRLDDAGVCYVSNEHAGFFYNLTVLTHNPQTLLRVVE